MKKINFYALLTLCALVLSATNTFAFTVKWKASAGSSSTGVYAYAWNVNNETEKYFGEWPGKIVTAGTDGWYSVTIPDGATAGVVVNNGGNGKQCGNMAPLSADACYLVNFNDWSFITANCGSGQGEDTPAFYIKWKIVAGADLWNAMFIYAWGGNPNKVFGDWPGLEVQLDDKGWYTAIVPKNQTPGNVIINNSLGDSEPGSQLPDIENLTSNSCFEVNLTTVTAVAVTCPGLGFANPNAIAKADVRLLNDQISIKANQSIKQVEIYNVLGARIFNLKDTGTSSSINATYLKTGVYLVKATLNDGSVYTQKIIKQ